MENEVEFDESGNVVEPAAGPEHESAENQVEEQDERRAESSLEEDSAEEQVNDESITDDEREAIRARRREERMNR